MPTTRRKRANPPDQPENNNHLADQPENAAEVLPAEQAPAPPVEAETEPTLPPASEPTPTENIVYQPVASLPPQPLPSVNGERAERQEYTPPIEGGRRTARGELFRRPPQPPVPPAAMVPVAGVPLQAPAREISLPLGNLLHLAYNPGYTGADEARSMLLHQLAGESKAGGRARCWNCGSIAVAYERWNTRSRTFGEIGIAFCEICGVWSVM
jgi:hypothetical protein